MGARAFFRFKFLAVGAIALASGAHAQRVGCAPEVFRALFESRELLGQKNRSFRQKGLLPEGGGLCGPTCALNVLRVIEVAWDLELGLKDPAEEVAAFRAENRKRGDILRGMDENELRRFLSKKLDGTEVRVKSRRYPHVKEFSDEEFAGENFIAIAGIHIFKNIRTSRASHFMVFKSVDRAKQEVTVIDPNAPYHHLRVGYHPVGYPGNASVPTYELDLPEDLLGLGDPPYRYVLDGLVRVEKPTDPQ